MPLALGSLVEASHEADLENAPSDAPIAPPMEPEKAVGMTVVIWSLGVLVMLVMAEARPRVAERAGAPPEEPE